MLDPGAIIGIKSCKSDTMGRVQLDDGNGNIYILAGINHDIHEINEEINNGRGFVVRIQGNSIDQHPLVIMNMEKRKYYNNLINYFYIHRQQKKIIPPVASLQSLNIWEARWKQAAGDWENVICRPINSQFIQLPNEFSWAESVYIESKTTPRWTMPVFQSRYALPDLNQALLFSSQNHFKNYEYPPPCCYRPLYGFPQKYRAKIIENRQRGIKSRPLRIVLHGFLRPDIAHYKFWTHVVCGSIRAKQNTQINREEERLYWQKWLDVKNIPSKDLFANCEDHDLAATCNCSGIEHFKKIHYTILHIFNLYLKKIVTFLSEAKTIGLRIAVYGNVAHLRANACEKEEINGRNWYPRLAMAGICHNWNENEPVVHLFVKTFFLGGQKSLWGLDDHKFWDKHRDADTDKMRLEII